MTMMPSGRSAPTTMWARGWLSFGQWGGASGHIVYSTSMVGAWMNLNLETYEPGGGANEYIDGKSQFKP